MKSQPALCLDLDGTVRRSKSDPTGFIKGPDDIELMPGIAKLIWRFKGEGYLILGISNQGGVAHGHKTEEQANAEVETMLALFGRNHPFDMIHLCFSMEGGKGEYNRKSLLRKPGTGMLAICEYEFDKMDIAIDWSGSLFVGDREEDHQCAVNAGIDYYHVDKFINSIHQFEVTEKGARFSIPF